MRIRRHLYPLAVLAALCGASLALAAGGCGGDDEPSASTEPEFTVPTTATTATTATALTTLTTPPTQTSSSSGGATTPEDPNGSGGTSAPPNSSGGTPGGTSTITPEEAAENFERYCRENPEACGE